jgi:hypothetical protein
MRTITFAALLLASGYAFAQPYVALDLGQASLVADEVGKQKTGSLSRIGAGYRFGAFGLELVHLDADGGGGSSDSTFSDWEADGLGAFASARVPVGPVALSARAGAYRLDGRVEVSETLGNVRTVTVPSAWSAWMPAVALGVDYSVEHVSLRVIAEHIAGRAGLDRMRTISLGVAYHF